MMWSTQADDYWLQVPNTYNHVSASDTHILHPRGNQRSVFRQQVLSHGMQGLHCIQALNCIQRFASLPCITEELQSVFNTINVWIGLDSKESDKSQFSYIAHLYSLRPLTRHQCTSKCHSLFHSRYTDPEVEVFAPSNHRKFIASQGKHENGYTFTAMDCRLGFAFSLRIKDLFDMHIVCKMYHLFMHLFQLPSEH